MSRILSLLVFVLVSHSARTANILVFMPYGSHSHKATLIPLIQGLAERNHSVTFITNQESPELRQHKMVYELEEVVVPHLDYSVLPKGEEQSLFELASQPTLQSQVKIFRHLSGLVDRVIDATYTDRGVQRVLKRGRFDLLLLSQVVSYAGYPLAWHFKCPYILTSPNVLMTDSAYLMGDSEHTEYVPFFLAPLTDRMNLLQRVVNTVATHSLNFFQDNVIFPRIQPAIAKYFPRAPPLTEIKANISAAFANTHPALSYPRSYPPGVVELGAIHCRPAKRLPRHIEQFVSRSGSAGFIVFGVGSIIRMDEMPHEMVEVFIRVFARLNQRIIWQWRGTNKPANLSDNILLLDWLPQQDLLGHKKCKLFMTHGGLLSTQEAVYHGVPVLGLPFINDQLLNMDKAVHDGYALQVRWNQIDESLLYNAVHDLIYGEHYSRRVKRLSSLLHDQLETPLDRGIYWIEYIIRHKGVEHLRLGSRNLNRFQRASADVYLFLALFSLVLLAIVCKLVSRCAVIAYRSELIARLWKLELF